MRTDERHQLLVDRVLETGSATVAELVDLVGASEATVRRDLAELDGRGVVRRVHGGARRPGLRGVDVVPGAQPHRNPAGRDRVARAAAALLAPGEAVVLDSGSTCVELARALASDEHRVVPLSLPVAEVLARRAGVTVTLPGGDLRPGSLSFVGPMTERSLTQLRVDTAVLSPCGLDLRGATAFDLGDAAVMRAAMGAAERRVLVCDESKWGRAAFAWFADLEEFDVLVTDHVPTAEEAERLAEAGVEVVVA